MNINATDSGSLETGDVTRHDTTAPVITAGFFNVLNNLASLQARYEERVKNESVEVWVNPFDRNTPPFRSRDECQLYMDVHHGAAIQQAKEAGRPEEEYTPRKKIIPPKIRPQDLLLNHPVPTYTGANVTVNPAVQAAEAAAASAEPKVPEELQKVLSMAKDRISSAQRTGAAHTNPDLKLLDEPEPMAVAKLPKLSTESLQELGRQASYLGKMSLARAVRKQLISRHVPSAW